MTDGSSNNTSRGDAPSRRKMGMVSLGCPKNLVDSEVMLGFAARAGYEITNDQTGADVIVVNTCGFIDAAKKESIETILEMAALKKTGRCQQLIVTGCLVERYREELKRELPEVDAFIGTNEVERIVEVSSNGFVPLRRGGASSQYLYDDSTPRLLTTPSHTAYVKIAEGCDHPCTFCVIPQMRGSFRSRRPDSLVRELEMLASRGVREVNLIGQDTTCYGQDIGFKGGLAALLRALARVDGIEWVRFLYAYPNNITDELLDVIAEEPKICKYLDVPLQHASTQVLKAMRRGGSRESLMRLVRRIRDRVPGVAIRTTFIVGFPGEAEEDFDELTAFVREAEFESLGVFTYSDEKQAPAFRLEEKVAARTALLRRSRLLREQKKISRRAMRRQVGKSIRVLVEGASDETDLLLKARAMWQAPEIDGSVLINDLSEGIVPYPGLFATVEITGSLDYDLIGRITETEVRQRFPLQNLRTGPVVAGTPSS